jgi:hypothetical protein
MKFLHGVRYGLRITCRERRFPESIPESPLFFRVSLTSVQLRSQPQDGEDNRFHHREQPLSPRCSNWLKIRLEQQLEWFLSSSIHMKGFTGACCSINTG